ncbi:expressed unknown protein [Seminavis robusta]|uniref:Uncharacterized protein n=1 Tax=Seminavis robusta TaxID=568900 RepID=A0A9N8H9T7_9STRA|nr:expressed unknown protein [Seminavis robusta]|eukprot:Sro126_g060560.1 n/a (532) ;mRNA; r:51560-53155
MAKVKRRRYSQAYSCAVELRFWIPLVALVVILEIGILGFLMFQLETQQQHHHHHNHPWGGSLSAVRRKLLRLWDPHHWNQKNKESLSSMARELGQVPPFQQSKFSQHHLDNNNNHTQPSLDNFYSRPHLSSSSLDDHDKNNHNKQPFLITVGSDGSGTRMFVQTLMDLGVPMVVDSYDTMDINAEEIVIEGQHGRKDRGWPPLVHMVMGETHRAANYTLHDLTSQAQRQQVMTALLKLKSSLLQKAHQLKKEERDLITAKPPAAGVQLGFKAPIAMLLLPLLKQVFGSIKVLHVVRDGRDVALSDNTSPLQKFYRAFYGPRPFLQAHGQQQKPPNVQLGMMQLWADWNQQVYQWEQEQVQKQLQQQILREENSNVIDNDSDNSNNNQPQLDYMVLRTEDLLHPDTRLEALVQLAEFVGARVTPRDLCCQSQRPLHDMGQSNNREALTKDMFLELLLGRKDRKTQQQEERAVKARYGKWRHAPPELLWQLEDIGKETLQLFGYNPPRRFLDRAGRGLHCDEILREDARDCPQ